MTQRLWTAGVLLTLFWSQIVFGTSFIRSRRPVNQLTFCRIIATFEGPLEEKSDQSPFSSRVGAVWKVNVLSATSQKDSVCPETQQPLLILIDNAQWNIAAQQWTYPVYVTEPAKGATVRLDIHQSDVIRPKGWRVIQWATGFQVL